MKKLLWIVAGICLVAAFASCSKKESAPAVSAAPAAASQAASAEVGNLGAFTFRMNDNFEWGDGYSGSITDSNLLGGQSVKAGETYSLKMKFTVSRDLEDEIYLGFADNTEAAGWWKWLSSEGGDELYIPNSRVNAGQEVSTEVTINILYDSTSNSTDANKLVFETRGEGTPGRSGSGVQGPFNINFTEFVLTKK